jgi:sugar-specific transcriptional regulator TrmB
MKTIHELKELNLENNEIKVYLSCLSLGSAKVQEIAKKSKLIRTTTYGVLKTLIEKGLVSITQKNNVSHYQAADPNQLLEILEEKKKKINSILPTLEKIKKEIPKQHNVQLFEGKEGLKTIFNDLLAKPNTTIKIIGFMRDWPELFGIWTDIYYRKKKENKIKTLVLMDENERKNTQNKTVTNAEFRYLKNLTVDAESFIYNDKILFISFEENDQKGIVIQDKEMAKLQSILFDKLWSIAKN